MQRDRELAKVIPLRATDATTKQARHARIRITLSRYVEAGRDAFYRLLRVEAEETELERILRRSIAVVEGTTVEDRRRATSRRMKP